MQVMADDGDRRAERVVGIVEQFDRTVVTLLIAINIIHIAGASIATMQAIQWMGDSGSVVATVVMTLLVFFFSETIPKNIARANSDAYMLWAALPIRICMILLKPIAIVACISAAKRD